MYNLEGKKLLVMDRTALAACAVKRAKEMGVKTIVANFYPIQDSPSKQLADETVDIDISNTDEMVALIKKYKVDGVFVGWTDSHLPFYAEICEKVGLPCIGTKEQFEIFSNNKIKFKEACKKYNVPTVPEYEIDISFNRQALDKISYPAMVKPADGSGGRGVKRCDNEKELVEHYRMLYNASNSKKIICEKYMETPHEIFLNYTIQDGFVSLSAAFMCHHVETTGFNSAPTILHMYSPSYIKLYKDTVEEKVIKMFHGFGIKNAVISLQGFISDGKFYFHETGYRMGGGRSYVFTKELNNVSALDMLIEYSLTGQSKNTNLKKYDNPYFDKACCNYYVPLKPGKISKINGYETVKEMPEVLEISTCHFIGDEISKTNSLDSVIYRMHVMADDNYHLAKTLEKISSTLEILDDKGNEMQLEKITFERVQKINY